MRRYRLNRNERQDQGASSHRERFAEYAPTYVGTPFFLTWIFCKNNLNFEHLFCKSFLTWIYAFIVTVFLYKCNVNGPTPLKTFPHI